MRVLYEFTTEPHRCAYLPDRSSTLEYQVVERLQPDEYEALMDRGYRKFGQFLFRPVCRGCRECRPIRIPIDRFQPDRSQRRAWKRNTDLEVRLGRPEIDDVRLDLYHRYHESQAGRKGWPRHDRGVEEYANSFVRNPLPALEISLWEGEALRAIVLTEITPNAVSGIYHYHDPELSHRSLGTFCMLQTLELARGMEKRWAYFGFYVAGCASLAYKARFRPCEIMDQEGVWKTFERGDAL